MFGLDKPAAAEHIMTSFAWTGARACSYSVVQVVEESTKAELLDVVFALSQRSLAFLLASPAYAATSSGMKRLHTCALRQSVSMPVHTPWRRDGLRDKGFISQMMQTM